MHLFCLKQDFSLPISKFGFWSPSFTHYCNSGPNPHFKPKNGDFGGTKTQI